MSEQYNVISGWLIPIQRALEAHGLDAAESMAACGIDINCMKNPEARVPIEKIILLIESAGESLGIHSFAISIAKHFHPGAFHVLGYAVMSSLTLKDALERFAKYRRVLSNTCDIEIYKHENQYSFEVSAYEYKDTGRPVLSRDSLIAYLGTVLRFSIALAGTELKLNKVYFAYNQPEFDTTFLSDFFQCPVEFGHSTSGIIFDSKLLEAPLPSGNPLITQTHERLLNDFISRIDKEDLSHLVKLNICKLLPLGTPSQSEIASTLGMSLRNLQRKLNEKGTSFKAILEDSRKQLAIDYIKQPHISLGEISYLVGFSNLSNFNRAFKRWTLKTPGEFRQHLLE